MDKSDLPDLLYGLIVQAQEMQKFALDFQKIALKAVDAIPIAAKSGTREAAREILIEGSQEAAESLKAASKKAIDASHQLRRTMSRAWLVHILWLAVAAIVITAIVFAGLGIAAKRKMATLDALTVQVQEMEAAREKLETKLGKIKLSTCSDRPCVRVDERPGRYGDSKKGELYMVIYGY